MNYKLVDGKYEQMGVINFSKIDEEYKEYIQVYIAIDKATKEIQAISTGDAGKNRIVPIHDKIYPLVKQFYNSSNEYLFMDEGKPFTYAHFKDVHLKPFLEAKGMEHTMHDTRHTCATLTKDFGCDDLCRKLILGHHVSDITNGTYTHILPQRLLLEINKIKV